MKDKHYNITLKILTPTFIGDGQKLNKKEYYSDEKNNCIYQINENQLFKLIKQKKLIDKFEQFMYSGSSLNYFFKANNIEFSQEYRMKKLDFDDMFDFKKNDVSTFIRDGLNNIYIPASSLKGAIRTAIIYKKSLEVKNKDGLFKSFKEKKENDFNKILFKNNGGIKEYFSKIAISDGYSDDISMGIYGKNDFSTYKKGRNNISTYRECVRSGEFSHKLTIYENNFDITFDYILEALDDFIVYQIDLFDKISDNYDLGCGNIIFGGGSGYFNKNIHYALSDEPYKITESIKCRLSKKFKHIERDTVISPRTLKFAGKTNDIVGVCELLGAEI